MKSYVITIMDNEKSVQVAQRCIKSAAKYGIEVEHWKATTPADGPIDLLLKDDVKIAGLHELYSRIANCSAAFHSHFSLWKNCIATNEDHLIFEHDAFVTDPIPVDVNYNKLISFGKPSYGKWRQPTQIGVNPLTSKGYLPGAHCYMLKPEAAKLLVSQAKIMARPTDVYINTQTFPWVQEYYPWPVEARDSFTTIQKEAGCLAKHSYGETYEII